MVAVGGGVAVRELVDGVPGCSADPAFSGDGGDIAVVVVGDGIHRVAVQGGALPGIAAVVFAVNGFGQAVLAVVGEAVGGFVAGDAAHLVVGTYLLALAGTFFILLGCSVFGST